MVVHEEFYYEHRQHFQKRLKERYGIILSDDEYDKLVKSNGLCLYHTSGNSLIELHKIHGQRVICLRHKKNQNRNESTLKTVVAWDAPYYFVPRLYKNNNISIAQFKKDVDVEMAKVRKMANWLRQHPDEKRHFFVDKPFKDVPDNYYDAAYRMVKFDLDYPTEQVVASLYPNIDRIDVELISKWD